MTTWERDRIAHLEAKCYRVSHKVTVEYIRFVVADSATQAEEWAADMGDTEADEYRASQTAWKARRCDQMSRK
ncbi:hypothetical protein LCGC14_1137590 [marine sediment metagenome]|uniref:Uncharacterized protein n=1 Tax=marine sediment metagenome TaxID=412755 RepID=A0A0F9Q4Y9_9ZZZZ